MVNNVQALTDVTKSYILEILEVLDPPPNVAYIHRIFTSAAQFILTDNEDL